MQRIPLHQFLNATNGRASQPATLPDAIQDISLDSRTITTNDVFWAIQGENYDGHDYVESALSKGAAACIVQHSQSRNHASRNQPLIHVDNTLKALHQFSIWYRQQFRITSIGITGSYGKTTAREMIDAVLSTTQHGIQNQNNNNNEIGVPLTLLKLQHCHQYLVMEMGAAKPGDIDPLTEMAAPNVGVITGIGPAHLDGFHTIEQIASTKGDLIASLPGDGLALIPGDSKWKKKLTERASCEVQTFGFSQEDTYQATRIASTTTGVTFNIANKRYHLPVHGKHYLSSALIAIGVATHLGYSPSDIQLGFDAFQPLAGRGQIVQRSPLTIIDDTYNANPASCRAACQMLADWETMGRRFLIVGDMLELGPDSARYHTELGQFASDCGIHYVFAVGDQSKHVINGSNQNKITGRQLSERRPGPEFQKHVLEELLPGDVILIKGSRGMKMENFVKALKNHDCEIPETAIR